ncbi:hypothetical protein [Hymenobacter negativus]|uniref:ATP-grasp domain-containing protein n=1 Tax=Hymenobacter negativus TaxID=2795026 RepID=A0ABS3QP79_9BACT|nr:hypothetical protein [Hymenobacter negativus]MBO2013095.1 hypothetical protein [Hymenobacter negativus]
MILVLSNEAYEQGTDPVLSWLLHYQVPFVKVSLHDLVTSKVRYHVDLKTRDIFINGQSVKHSITTIWHRRFLGAANAMSFAAGTNTDQLNFEIRTELHDLVSYLELLFRDKTWLTAFNRIKVNKLEVMDLASQAGLKVPHTRIINNRDEVLAFYHELGGHLISKPIADVRGSYQQGDSTHVVLTTNLDAGRIAALPEHFFPSLFQEKVAVDFEVRVFYLDGRFFATGTLFSGTERNVDKKLDSGSERVHYVPYQLPAVVEEQLTQLMRTLELNTGSIDLLRTVAGEYVFIEVNPVGQYLAESTYCHYALEKEIAEWLINQEISCASLE